MVGIPFLGGIAGKPQLRRGLRWDPRAGWGRAVPRFAVSLSPSVNENVTTVTS